MGHLSAEDDRPELQVLIQHSQIGQLAGLDAADGRRASDGRRRIERHRRQRLGGVTERSS